MKSLLKKLLTFTASLAVILSLVTGLHVVNAEEPGTITITSSKNDLEGKSFKIYQLMSATQSGSEYSYDLNADFASDMKAAINAIDTGANITTDNELIIYLNNLADTDGKSDDEKAQAAAKVRQFADAMRTKALAKTVYKTATSDNASSYSIAVPYGYYLVVENNAETGSTSLCMLDAAAATATIAIKSYYPEVVKKVKDESYTQNDGFGVGFTDIADYDIGDTVPFEFISSTPNMTSYETYKYIFHDTMSSGLTFDSSSVEVTVGSKTLTKDVDYTVSTNPGDGCTFHVEITNLKAHTSEKDVEVKVTYNATLNANANVGQDGNTNTVKLEYSSNPYDSNETNETTTDKVIVFTFDTEVVKVDVDGNELAGAQFKLYSDSACKNVIKLTDASTHYVVDKNGDPDLLLTSSTDKNIVIKGLDAGTYYLKEEKAPDGYDLLTDPITITVTATYEDRQNWTGTGVEAFDGLVYTFGPDVYIDSAKTKGNTVAVKNFLHGTLPSTGGMGNYVFYVAGGLMMVAAGIFFLRKKEEC